LYTLLGGQRLLVLFDDVGGQTSGHHDTTPLVLEGTCIWSTDLLVVLMQ